MLTHTQFHDTLAHIELRNPREFMQTVFQNLHWKRLREGYTRKDLASFIKVDPKEIARVELKPHQNLPKNRKCNTLYVTAALAYFERYDLNELVYGALVENYDPGWIDKKNR
ncbi:MAG: hypothetical protein IJ112_08280 [Oscillospiraceae bacterium]|nr:hypothetical protein [Oscillospiraceae bacterium]